MKRKIVALWVISCLAVSNAKAQFNTVSDNVYRYKVKKVEEKFLFPVNNQVDSVTANLPQQETHSVDNKQKQWTSSYPSITYPLKSIKVTSPYGYRRDPFTGKLSWHNGCIVLCFGAASADLQSNVPLEILGTVALAE